jgi:hypothetical protein
MIIWTGLGFLVVVFVLVIGFFFYDHDSAAWYATDKPFAYTLLLTGILSGLLGYFLRRPERKLVDKATGQGVKVRHSHSLFFIPMVYWGPILIAWALFLLIRGQ